LSQEKRSGNCLLCTGKNGVKSRTSKKYHKLYCIRLVRVFLKIHLDTKKMPIIILITILHNKKWVINSSMRGTSCRIFFGKKRA
jgi:hypothetical protein